MSYLPGPLGTFFGGLTVLNACLVGCSCRILVAGDVVCSLMFLNGGLLSVLEKHQGTLNEDSLRIKMK